MARRPRILFEGALYHVMSRGNGRQAIFVDDRDRERLVESLAERVERYGVELHLYCLMPNHLHLQVRTPLANLPEFMGSLLTSYTAYFNLRHQRVGHLMQGRYKAILVEDGDYGVRLSRYIHLNPVRASGIADLPLGDRIAYLRAYRWSSYRAYIGLARPEEFVLYDSVLASVPGPTGWKAGTLYRRYVEAAVARSDVEFDEWIASAPVSIGSPQFTDDMERRYEDEAAARVQREDVACRGRYRVVPADRILEAVAVHFGLENPAEIKRQRRNDSVRPVVAALLVGIGGLTQRQAAEVLGLTTGAAVSLQLRRLRQPSSFARLDDVVALERKLMI